MEEPIHLIPENERAVKIKNAETELAKMRKEYERSVIPYNRQNAQIATDQGSNPNSVTCFRKISNITWTTVGGTELTQEEYEDIRHNQIDPKTCNVTPIIKRKLVYEESPTLGFSDNSLNATLEGDNHELVRKQDQEIVQPISILPIKKLKNKTLTGIVPKEILKAQKEGKIGKIKLEKKASAYKVAKEFIKKYVFIHLEGSLYVYDKPIYRRLDKHSAKVLFRQDLPEDDQESLGDSGLYEIYKNILTDPEIQKTKEEVEVKGLYICFRNVIFDIKRRIMIEPTPDFYFFSYVDVYYDPNRVIYGNHFEKYLEHISGGDKELIELICQMIGYILSNSMAAKAVFFLVGARDAGKTTFGEFLQILFGQQNCCSVPIQDLNKRFYAQELCGKKLCFNMELKDEPITDTGMIKALSGGDMIMGEKKGVDIFKFKNDAKLLYGMNALPDVTNAENKKIFFERLVIIPFRYSVPVEERIEGFANLLIQESNYIVHKCIQALDRLIKNNYKFDSSPEIEIMRKQYMGSSIFNNVIEFAKVRCILDANKRTYTKVLYEEYLKYCLENECCTDEVYSLKAFSKLLADHFGNDVKKDKWREVNDNSNGFVGLALKTKGSEQKKICTDIKVQ